jgi:hypothetical protein
MKKGIFQGCLLVIAIWAVLGCQRPMVSNRMDPVKIPDREYNVTVHEGYPTYYGVLFDIPDDDREVGVLQTKFTRQVGRDTPQKYLHRFEERIKSYRAFRVSEGDGTPGGYLLLSNRLDYESYEDPEGNRIVIRIVDPALRGCDAP